MRRRSLSRVLSSLSLATLVIASMTPSIEAYASEPRVVVAGLVPIPKGDVVVATAATTSFDVLLRQPRAQQLSTYLNTLSNPASVNYRRFLTTAQFARRFGAPATAIANVTQYFKGFDLRATGLSKGHIILHVDGATTDVARALNASLVTVRRSDGVLATQLTTQASIPSSVANDVTSIVGISSVVSPQSASLVAHQSARASTPSGCASAGAGASLSSTTPNSLGGYTVAQQAQLYGIDKLWANGDNGAGQTIGIYELGSFTLNDVTNYLSCYSISPSISNTNVDGGATGGPTAEATLDIEEAAALAPGATLEVYSGPNSSTGPVDVYQQMADNNTANLITTSWGTCETDPNGSASAEQAIFEQMAAQGQTVLAAAGDNGSSDCAGVTTKSPAVDDPASQPFVTGVGGLTVSNIAPLVQTVWNDGTSSGGGAGGGGVSQLWSRPSWQSAPGITSAATMRMVPDLSVMADPSTGFIMYYSGGGKSGCQGSNVWCSVGGTSIGSPLVSALVADSAQGCGTTRLGLLNPALYKMASTGYVDVTSGNNDLGGVGVYSAAPGYDMASGLGSPNPGTFSQGLCPLQVDSTKSSFALSSAAPKVTGVPLTLTLDLRDQSGNPLPNALIHVVAAGTSGTVTIGGEPLSTNGPGTAALDINTDLSGHASVTVASSVAQPVVLSASFANQTFYTNTLVFTLVPVARKIVTTHIIIRTLTPLASGFRVIITPIVTPNTRAVYQYSINNGTKWVSFAPNATSAVVTRLPHHHTYRVIIRAVRAGSVIGISAPKNVTTV